VVSIKHHRSIAGSEFGGFPARKEPLLGARSILGSM
jgi:hypothetical protein